MQNEYKKTTAAYALNKEKSELELAEKLELTDRVHRSAQRDCFVTLKDHKPGFRSNPQCRLLNPSKSELGKVAKLMLQRINSELRGKTNLKQWRRTSETRAPLHQGQLRQAVGFPNRWLEIHTSRLDFQLPVRNPTASW